MIGLYVLGNFLSHFRQHVVQWRRVHPQLYSWTEAPSIGLQAVLFNSSSLGIVVESLKRATQFNAHMDIEISKHRAALGFQGFLLEPNLVRHVGRMSSLGLDHQTDRDRGDHREYLVDFCI